jgi:hypothetical protein
MSKNSNTGLLFGAAAIAAALIFFGKKTVTKLNPDVPKINEEVNTIINKSFSKSNQDHINKLNPAVRNKFIAFLNDIIKMGYAVVITSSYRPTSEQIILKKQNSKNATPGYSMHEYGLALDLNVVKNGKWLNKNSPLKAWIDSGIVALAKDKYNMRWGGDFKGYLDPIHYNFGMDYNAKKLYAQALKVFGSPANFHGNELKV